MKSKLRSILIVPLICVLGAWKCAGDVPLEMSATTKKAKIGCGQPNIVEGWDLAVNARAIELKRRCEAAKRRKLAEALDAIAAVAKPK